MYRPRICAMFFLENLKIGKTWKIIEQLHYSEKKKKSSCVLLAKLPFSFPLFDALSIDGGFWKGNAIPFVHPPFLSSLRIGLLTLINSSFATANSKRLCWHRSLPALAGIAGWLGRQSITMKGYFRYISDYTFCSIILICAPPLCPTFTASDFHPHHSLELVAQAQSER